MEYYNTAEDSTHMPYLKAFEDLQIKYEGLRMIMMCSGKPVERNQCVNDSRIKALPLSSVNVADYDEAEDKALKSNHFNCSVVPAVTVSSDDVDHRGSRSGDNDNSIASKALISQSTCSQCVEYLEENRSLKESVSYMIHWAKNILQMLNHVARLDDLKSLPHFDNDHVSNVVDECKRCAELESAIKKFVNTNKQWKKYCEEMDREKEELKRKCGDLDQHCKTLEAKLKAEREQSKRHLESQQKMIDNLKLKEQCNYTSVRQPSFVSDANSDKSVMRQRATVSKLMEALTAAQDEATAKQEELDVCRKQADERIEMLGMQLTQFKEDFINERRDRARAHEKAENLEKQLRSLQQSISASMVRPGETLRQISQNVAELWSPGFVRDETDDPLVGRTEVLGASVRSRADNADEPEEAEMNLSLNSDPGVDVVD